MEAIKKMSLKKKLLMTTFLMVVAIVFVLTLNLWRGLSAMNEEVVGYTSEVMENQVVARIQSEGASFGEKVTGFINSSYQLPLTVAKILEDSIIGDRFPFDRDQVSQISSSVLEKNTQISSIYAQFEKNGYDGEDGMYFQTDSLHSVASSGALEIYWVRNPDGSLEQQRVESSDEKYADERNEFGIRESEWFLCARDNKKPCLMEPYLYEISEDYSEMMTSLTVPVLKEGKFRGLVGVDLNLPIFDKMTNDLSQRLFDGESKVTLLSSMGFVVSSSHYKDKLSRPLKESHPNYDEQLLTLYQQGGFMTLNDHYVISYPIEIAASQSTWSVLIEVPISLALAQRDEMTSLINSSINSITMQQLIFALILTAIAVVLMVVLVTSITRPINQLNKAMKYLASADGDLTKSVELDTHEELIELSQSVNQFIGKLRNMIVALKDVNTTARNLSQQAQTNSDQTRNATSSQQHELDSVVTATNEMTATAQEVSRFAADAAENATEAKNEIQNSSHSLHHSVELVQSLTEGMSQASSTISDVAARSEDIHRILDVIRTIAEQTNLLALNAAIEAARAGEQGRGFAVVADEVRSLASKTQASTEEINSMIQSLQGGVDSAVAIIEQGTEKANQAMTDTQASFEALTQVAQDIESISDHITQVATAAEEQSSVNEEINMKLTAVGDAATDLAELANASADLSTQLESEMASVHEQLSLLKT